MAAGAADQSSNGRAPYDGERTVGQLFAAASADLSALVHDEIALAKAEIRTDVIRGLSGGVSGIVGGVMILAAVPMISFALAYLIHFFGVPLGGSFALVALLYILLGAALFLLAKRQFKKIEKPDRTIEGAKATADVLKNARPRPATKEEIDRALGRIQ